MIFDAGRETKEREKGKVRGTKHQLDTKIINKRFRLHYVWFGLTRPS